MCLSFQVLVDAGRQLANRPKVASARSVAILPPGTKGDYPLIAFDEVVIGEQVLGLYRLGPNSAGYPGPPGARWPSAGQVWLSDAVAVQLANNPYLAALVAGQEAGRIGPDGLRDPDELVAYIGVSAEQALELASAWPAPGFGAAPGESALRPEEIPPRALGIAIAMAAVVAFAGAFGLSAVASAATGPSRRRRLAALELLGCPTRVMRAVAICLTALSSGVGAAAGCLAFPLMAPLFRQVSLFGVNFWWRQGAREGGGAALCGVLSIVIMAALAGTQVARDPIAVRRRAEGGRVSAWRALPLGLVFAVVAGVVIGGRGAGLHQPMPTPVVAALMAATMIGVGAFAWAGPLLVRWASTVFAGGGLARRVASARASHHARTTNGLAIGVVAAMILLGAAIGYISAAQRFLGEETALDDSSQWLHLAPRDSGDAASLTRSVELALAASSLEGANVVAGDGTTRVITAAADVGVGDSYCEFLLRRADALKVAAASVENTPADLARVDFGTNPMGRLTFSATSALVLIALVAGLIQTTLALGTGVIALQEERRDADSALLIAGMPRPALARIRVGELALTALPAPLASAGLAILLAVAYEHYDNLALPYVVARFMPLAALPVAVWLVFAMVVAAATPAIGSAAIRRE
jgi:hypothetical protein